MVYKQPHRVTNMADCYRVKLSWTIRHQPNIRLMNPRPPSCFWSLLPVHHRELPVLPVLPVLLSRWLLCSEFSQRGGFSSRSDLRSIQWSDETERREAAGTSVTQCLLIFEVLWSEDVSDLSEQQRASSCNCCLTEWEKKSFQKLLLTTHPVKNFISI